MNAACARSLPLREGDPLGAALPSAAPTLDATLASGQGSYGHEMAQDEDRWLRLACEPRRDGEHVVGLVVMFADVSNEVKIRHDAQFLAAAGEALSESLDYEVTLRRVAELAVPTVADWCTVTALDDEGALRRLACVHKDPAKRDACARYLAHFPPAQHRPEGLIAVVKEHGVLLQPEISEEALSATAQDDEHLALLHELGCRSCVVVPMISRGVAVGAISFMRGDGPRRYTERDVGLVRDLARRAALAVDNARLYRDAQRAIRFRDDFLATASHELKTPLTSLLLSVQSLKGAAEGGHLHDDRGDLSVRLARANAQVVRLERLIGQLLEVSRASSGYVALNPERVDLRDVVIETVDRFRDEAARSATPIACERLDEAVGVWDASRLDQVVTNLLGNAIKYGSGRPVRVRLENDGVARLVVQDEGIGIDRDILPKIFERFERARTVRHIAGFGLGLWIVREAVEAHGGTIRVESAPGRGSTFIVELPLRGAAPYG